MPSDRRRDETGAELEEGGRSAQEQCPPGITDVTETNLYAWLVLGHDWALDDTKHHDGNHGPPPYPPNTSRCWRQRRTSISVANALGIL